MILFCSHWCDLPTTTTKKTITEKQVHGKWEIDVSHFVSEKNANCIRVSGSLKFKRNRYQDIVLVESCEESRDDSDYNTCDCY